MSETNLTTDHSILLVRCPNGWCVGRAETNGARCTIIGSVFIFESTESLAKNLVRLIGRSGWEVQLPKRDQKGHFLPDKPKPCTVS